MTQDSTLFQGRHSSHCAFCNHVETSLPGWPLNGAHIVQRDAKICQRCVREVVQKAEALGLTFKDKEESWPK